MADYCDKCANKLGFEKESYPLYCEGCSKYFENKSLLKTILEWIGIKKSN